MGPTVFKVILCVIIGHIFTAFCNEGVSTEEFSPSSISSDETVFSQDADGNLPHADMLSEEPVELNSMTDREKAREESDLTLDGEVVLASTDLDETLVALENIAVNNSSNSTDNSTQVTEEKGNVTSIVVCSTGKENGGQPVELVNSTRLINILITETNVTDRRTTADCTLVLFYARYCPFSSMAAPHFNALPRAFPDIKLAAVDAMKHHSFNTQYGIVGVPTLMLFHNGRPAAKFNDSEYNLEAFARFITKYTGLQPHDKLYVTSADFGGPVSSVPTKETDYCLWLSWAFMLVCGLYFFSKSSWWRWISEAVQNTWREAEAQHEHGD